MANTRVGHSLSFCCLTASSNATALSSFALTTSFVRAYCHAHLDVSLLLRLIGRVEPYWQASNPLCDHLLLRHFIDALVRLAMAVHGAEFKDRPESVAYSLDHLITHDILPGASSAQSECSYMQVRCCTLTSLIPAVLTIATRPSSLCDTIQEVHEKQRSTVSRFESLRPCGDSPP